MERRQLLGRKGCGVTDYAETDRLRRQAMETASERLLATLWREHPRIMTHLRARHAVPPKVIINRSK